MTCKWCDGTGRVGDIWYGYCVCETGDRLLAEEQRARADRLVVAEDERQAILPGVNGGGDDLQGHGHGEVRRWKLSY